MTLKQLKELALRQNGNFDDFRGCSPQTILSLIEKMEIAEQTLEEITGEEVLSKEGKYQCESESIAFAIFRKNAKWHEDAPLCPQWEINKEGMIDDIVEALSQPPALREALAQQAKKYNEIIGVLREGLSRDHKLFGDFLDKYTEEELGNPSQLTGHNAVIEVLHGYKRARQALARAQKLLEEMG